MVKMHDNINTILFKNDLLKTFFNKTFFNWDPKNYLEYFLRKRLKINL